MLNQIVEIVKNASKLMLGTDYEVQQKGNASNYVTSSDINVQKYLSENLLKLLPGSAIIGEESDGFADAKEYTWVIDPIDGTANYIRGIGVSAISVGLLKNSRPFIGVIYQPYRDEVFTAEVGKGAWLNGQPIHVSDRDFSHGLLCSAMSLYNKDYAKPCFNIIERVYSEADDLRRLGSAAVELAYLAAGRVELYFEIRVFPWDAAAAIPLITEAGGQVECLFEKSMPLDKPFAIIAANRADSFDKLRTIVYEELPVLPY